MLVDVTNYPVIDNHCHPYPYGREQRPFWRCFNSTLFEQTEEMAKSTILLHMVTNELREFMGMDPASTMDEVIAERDRRYHADPKMWVNTLARDAHLEQAIVDITYPITAWKTKKFITQAELDRYYEDIDSYTIHKELRFEYIYDPLISKELSFQAFLEEYYAAVDAAVTKEKPVTFKSVIGYITGLDVGHPSRSEAEIAYYRYLQAPEDFANEKVLRDFMLHDSMNLCLKYDLPLQIHTGSGNTPLCRLTKMNPLLLHDFLSEEKNRKVTTIILHCGYPFLREAAYVVSHFGQVHLDVSQMVYHAGLAAESGFKELMETCPFTKVLFASDGGGIPEHTWYSAKYFKRALSRALGYYVEMGVFGEETAREYASLVLSGNAKRIYKL